MKATWTVAFLLGFLFAFVSAVSADPMSKGHRYRATVVCIDFTAVKSLVGALDRDANQEAMDLLNETSFPCIATEQTGIPIPFWPVVVNERVAEVGKYGIYSGTLQLNGENVFVYHIDNPGTAL